MNTKFFSILTLLLLLSSTLAFGLPTPTITITPATPVAGQALTCTVNGLTSGYLFLWTTPRATFNGNPLPGSFVQAGDSITCEAQKQSLFGTVLIGSATVTVVPPNSPPVINITQPRSGDHVVTGLPVAFTAAVSDPNGDAITTTWNFGDATPLATTQVLAGTTGVTHTFTSSGTFTVTATATDTHGASSSARVNLNVLANTFNVNLQTFSDNQFSVSQDTFFRGDSFFVGFTVRDQQGKPLPGLTVEGSLNHATNGFIAALQPFTGTVQGKSIVNGEPATKDGTYFFSIPALPLNDSVLGQNVVLVITFQGTEGGQAQKVITVLNNLPVISSLPALTLNAGTSKTFSLDPLVSDRETPDAQLTWGTRTIAGSGVTVAINPVTHNAIVTASAQATTSTVIFTVDDGDSGQASAALIVFVSVNGDIPPFAAFTAVNTSEAYVPVTFDASASKDIDGSIVNYTWDFGDGSTQVTTTPVLDHSFDVPGSYVVTLTVTDNTGLTNSASQTQTVTPVFRHQVPDKLFGAYQNLLDFHRINVVRIQPLVWKSSYSFGETVQLLVSLRNTGNLDEALQLDFSVLGTGITASSTQRLDRGSERMNTGLFFTVPTGLAPGQYVGKLEVKSRTEAPHVLGYWTLIVH